MTDTPYECCLDEATLKKAKEELNENPEERLGSIKSLREWAEREPWITAPSDPLFLLSILRTAKFSQLTARTRLASFLSAFSKDGVYGFARGQTFGCDKSVQILRESGVAFCLPGYDSQGRRIVFFRFGKMDTSGKTYSFQEYWKVVMSIFLGILFSDEKVQVNGLNIVFDQTGVDRHTLSFMGTDFMKRVTGRLNSSAPFRTKSISFYNTGPIFKTLFEMVLSVLSSKLRGRVKVHAHLTSLYKDIEMSMLPTEYLPDDYSGPSAGSTKDVLEQNVNDYLLHPSRRAFANDLLSGKYEADLGQRDKHAEPEASFRRLNVS